ncbi:hypothetical protein [Streptomyces carpinensis]|uniref:Uncharacterized protein n=1 Tax=Streptomyces carpinensis TaxID=66369 RepID=A0ABV1W571_9ACTN|nr:hypothetical protein [Streptomyces carpinensis]
MGTRADTTRRGFTARDITHRELGPVVELTALGPDREDRHRAIAAVLYTHYPRYTATDQGTSLLACRTTGVAGLSSTTARVTSPAVGPRLCTPTPPRCWRGFPYPSRRDLSW